MDIDKLKELIKREDEFFRNNPNSLGWDYFELGLTSSEIKQLEMYGIARIVFKSNKHTIYQLNRDRIMEMQKAVVTNPTIDIFDDIYGYDDIKQLILKVLNKQRSVGILFYGPPASAKSMFLNALQRLDGARYIVMTQTTKSALTELLITEQPSILLIDELDKANAKDYAALLTLLQSGVVQRNVFGSRIAVTLQTKVFATANYIERIPREIRSRFQVITFREYTEEELRQIGYHMLRNHPFGKEIVDTSLDMKVITDPRDFDRLGLMIETEDDIKRVLEIVKKYH